MISLERKTEPYELTLPYGVTVTVTPLTTAAMAAAQAEARKRLDAAQARSGPKPAWRSTACPISPTTAPARASTRRC